MSLYCDIGPDFFSERISRARKEYHCCECGKKIHKGQKYWYCMGKWEGEISSYRQHIECRDACYEIAKAQECIPFGSLREWLSECPAGSMAWDKDHIYNQERKEYDSIYTKNDRTGLIKRVRDYFASGIRASRLKSEQISEYNKRWEGRVP